MERERENKERQTFGILISQFTLQQRMIFPLHITAGNFCLCAHLLLFIEWRGRLNKSNN
jgi:hypothetical protein